MDKSATKVIKILYYIKPVKRISDKKILVLWFLNFKGFLEMQIFNANLINVFVFGSSQISMKKVELSDNMRFAGKNLLKTKETTD